MAATLKDLAGQGRAPGSISTMKELGNSGRVSISMTNSKEATSYLRYGST